MKDERDLSKIQAGDSVAVFFDGKLHHLESVTSATATLIRTPRGEWRRDNGKLRGSHDRFHWSDIRPITDEHRAAVKRGKLLSRVQGTFNSTWAKCNDRELETICVILSDAEKRAEKE